MVISFGEIYIILFFCHFISWYTASNNSIKFMDHSSNDVIFWYIGFIPVSRVIRIFPIISQNEITSFGNFKWINKICFYILINILFFKNISVNEYRTINWLDLISFYSNDSFYDLLPIFFECYNITPGRIFSKIRKEL